MTKPTVLVTGGAGFIGSHACLALSQAGFNTVTFDNFSAGDKSRVQWGPVVEGDITNTADLLAAMSHHKPVAVMHFAGKISVAESVKNPGETHRTNVMGTQTLLNAMKQCNVDKVVYSSSAAVYGIPHTSPISEDALKAPINPYGGSKLKAENLLIEAHPLKFATLRYFNAAGATPKFKLGYKRADPTHLIPLALMASLGQRGPLELYGSDYATPDGTAIRDYIHVADLAEAHVLALKHLLEDQKSLTLNLGTGRGYSVKEVLNTIKKVTGKEVPHRIASRRVGDPATLVADPRRAQKVLNWKPHNSELEKIIASDWDWHRSL